MSKILVSFFMLVAMFLIAAIDSFDGAMLDMALVEIILCFASCGIIFSEVIKK